MKVEKIAMNGEHKKAEDVEILLIDSLQIKAIKDQFSIKTNIT